MRNSLVGSITWNKNDKYRESHIHIHAKLHPREIYWEDKSKAKD